MGPFDTPCRGHGNRKFGTNGSVHVDEVEGKVLFQYVVLTFIHVAPLRSGIKTDNY